MKQRTFAVVILAIAALVLGSVMVGAQDMMVIRIVSQSPLSGDQSAQGIVLSRGAELAVMELSEALVGMGYTVEFAAYDDEATAEVGVANAETIVADASVLAVIGHFNSGVALPSLEVYEPAGLVMVSPANTASDITDQGLSVANRVVGRGDREARVAGEQLVSLGLSSVFVANDTRAYGAGLAEAFEAGAADWGLTVAGAAGAEDATTLVDAIVASAAEAVFLAGDVDTMAPLAAALRAAGYEGQFIGGGGIDTPAYAELAGEAAVGTFFATVNMPASAFSEEFIAAYTDAFGEAPLATAAEAYDATAVVLAAIARAAEAGMPTREAVAAEVRATAEFEGLSGTITFDANGDLVEANYYVLEVVSADPAEWNSNPVVNTIQIASPLGE